MAKVMVLYCDGRQRYYSAIGESKIVFYLIARGYSLNTIYKILEYSNNAEKYMKNNAKKIEWALRRLEEAKSVRLKTPGWFLQTRIVGPCNYCKILAWIIDNYDKKEYLQRMNIDPDALDSILARVEDGKGCI